MENCFDFINAQLSVWKQARDNYSDLGKTLRRSVQCGDLTVGLQCNPARITSTGADVTKEGLRKRKCFLCRDNRPDEQLALPIIEGFELLVNPFPIFPVHFTIASVKHEPQERIPEEVIAIAEDLPGLTIFFNGSKSGASAPDHLHLQAVPTSELPLMKFVEVHHPISEEGIKESGDMSANLPFKFYSGLIAPTPEGMKELRWLMSQCGEDENGNRDKGKINGFFWVSDEGKLRVVIVPRKSHRPVCYFDEGDSKIMVSPGAVDMAGLLILPRLEDYEKITEADVKKIYSEVGYGC